MPLRLWAVAAPRSADQRIDDPRNRRGPDIDAWWQPAARSVLGSFPGAPVWNQRRPLFATNARSTCRQGHHRGTTGPRCSYNVRGGDRRGAIDLASFAKLSEAKSAPGSPSTTPTRPTGLTPSCTCPPHPDMASERDRQGRGHAREGVNFEHAKNRTARPHHFEPVGCRAECAVHLG
jgi:hypothetical protein